MNKIKQIHLTWNDIEDYCKTLANFNVSLHKIYISQRYLKIYIEKYMEIIAMGELREFFKINY